MPLFLLLKRLITPQTRLFFSTVSWHLTEVLFCRFPCRLLFTEVLHSLHMLCSRLSLLCFTHGVSLVHVQDSASFMLLFALVTFIHALIWLTVLSPAAHAHACYCSLWLMITYVDDFSLLKTIQATLKSHIGSRWTKYCSWKSLLIYV